MAYHGLAVSRGGYAYRYARGGFLSGLARTVGRVAGAVGRVLVPGAAGVLGVLGGSSGSTPTMTMPGGMPVLAAASGGRGRPRGGVRGAIQRALPGGESGYLPVRRMNAGNAKAARRAIRRIKAVRKLLQGIERELPRRPCGHRGSPGRITRAEAARALRG